jgi:hypothetical protein
LKIHSLAYGFLFFVISISGRICTSYFKGTLSRGFQHHVFIVNQFLPSPRCSLASVVDTGGKFATGINDTSETGGKFANGVVDTSGAP